MRLFRAIFVMLMVAGAASLALSVRAQEPKPSPATPPAESETAAAEASPPARVGERVSRLLGNARTGRRQWVTGASVLVRPETGDPVRLITSTDERGDFRFEGVREGLYRVTLLRYGLKPIVKENVELRYPFRAVVEVVMEPAAEEATPAAATESRSSDATGTASASGLVVTRDGKRVGEVRLRLVRIDGTADPRVTLTGSEGVFSFTGLKPGAWSLEILGAGYLAVRVPVELNGDVEIAAILVAQPPDYRPAPLDLMPPEEPIPPPEPKPAETVDTAEASAP